MNSFFLTNIPKDILFSIKTIDFDAPTKECKHEIDQLLQKTVLLGGKRLRPLLTLLVGKLFDIDIDQLRDHAKSIEFIHAASLAHDDVVDKAEMRRGKPSINNIAGNKKAVLAGDYLLSNVIVTLSEKGNLDVLKKTATVISLLAEGEWIQHEATVTKKYTKEIITKIALNKTASVMSWCCVTPAMLAGVDNVVLGWCDLFGEKLGIAFQQIDDTLDFSDNKQKDYLLDLDNGIANSVLFYWMESNPDLKNDFQQNSIDNLENYPGLSEAILKVKTESEQLLLECHSILDMICDYLIEHNFDNKNVNKSKKALKSIVDFIGARSF